MGSFFYINCKGKDKQVFLTFPSLKNAIKGQIRSTDIKYGMGLGTRRVDIREA